MKAIFFTSCKSDRESDSIAALKYAVENIKITACVLDGDAVLEDFSQY